MRRGPFAKMEPKSRWELEFMSVEQLSEWLEHNGIPEEFCKKFEGKRHVFCCVCMMPGFLAARIVGR